MNAFEKLLLRRAKNSDLQRSAQWLANITLAYATEQGVAQMLPDELGQTMEHYGCYAETEDPDELLSCEAELGRAMNMPMMMTADRDEETFLG